MKEPMNPEMYDKILNDEKFLNDLWDDFDSSTKIGILEKSGINIFEEYVKVTNNNIGEE